MGPSYLIQQIIEEVQLKFTNPKNQLIAKPPALSKLRPTPKLVLLLLMPALLIPLLF